MPQLTFEWTNLLFSCDKNDFCGRYKDNRKSGNQITLIDPSSEDPDDFFYVAISGEVQVRTQLSKNEKGRAEETLRAFNLNGDQVSGTRWIVRERARVLDGYLKADEEMLDELESWSPSDRNEFIAGEIEATKEQPFSSIIRHFFARV